MKITPEDFLLKSHGRNCHPYHWWDSIHAAPEILSNCLKPQILDVTIRVADEIIRQGIRRIYFTGVGTSFFSGLMGTYALSKIAGIPSTNIPAYEFAHYTPKEFGEGCALIVISHSGGTEVCHKSAVLAKKRGAYVIGITDVAESRLGKEADDLILGPGGRDIAVPKSRSYMAALLRIMQLAAALGEHREAGTWDKWIIHFRHVPEMVRNALEISDDLIPGAAKFYVEQPNFYLVSAGPNWATALEGALKLLEGASCNAQGFEAEEAIHGPLAAIEEKDCIVLIAADGSGYERVERIAKGVKHLGNRVLAIGSPKGRISKYADHYVGINGELPELLTPIAYIVPIYLLSYWIAVQNRINPDILRTDDPKRYKALRIMMPLGSH